MRSLVLFILLICSTLSYGQGWYAVNYSNNATRGQISPWFYLSNTNNMIYLKQGWISSTATTGFEIVNYNTALGLVAGGTSGVTTAYTAADTVVSNGLQVQVDGNYDSFTNWLATNTYIKVETDPVFTNWLGTNVVLVQIGSNTTHKTSNGTDHGYIDQDLQTTASPSWINGLFTGYLHINDFVGSGTVTPNTNFNAESSIGGGVQVGSTDTAFTSGDFLGTYEFYTSDGSASSAGVAARLVYVGGSSWNSVNKFGYLYIYTQATPSQPGGTLTARSYWDNLGDFYHLGNILIPSGSSIKGGTRQILKYTSSSDVTVGDVAEGIALILSAGGAKARLSAGDEFFLGGSTDLGVYKLQVHGSAIFTNTINVLNGILTNGVPLDLGGGAIVNPLSFRAYVSSTQSVNDVTRTKVVFDGESFDAGSKYDPSSNYRYTPGVQGYYQINSQVQIAPMSGKWATLYLYKNGSQYSLGIKGASYVSNDQGLILTDVVALDTDDYVEIYIEHAKGSAADLLVGSTNSNFSGFLVETF